MFLSRLILGKRRPLITGSELHTVYIKNSIRYISSGGDDRNYWGLIGHYHFLVRFSYFGDIFHRNNLPNGICRYDFQNKSTWLCNIFRLGENFKIE